MARWELEGPSSQFSSTRALITFLRLMGALARDLFQLLLVILFQRHLAAFHLLILAIEIDDEHPD